MVSSAVSGFPALGKPATVRAMWLFLLACVSAPTDEFLVTDWEIEPAVITSPRVDTASFAASNGDGIGAVFAQFLPNFAEGNPAWDVPMQMLAVGMHESVSDPGACPFEVLEGDASSFRSECRSADGYVWAGGYDEREWADGEIARHAYTFDLSVTADVDDAAFSTLELAGTVALSTTDSVTHVDIDMSASLKDYFETLGQTGDPRIQAWADWQASGSLEFTETTIRVEAAANIGGSGGLPMGGDLAIDAGCSIEPSGELALGGEVAARFAGCDACADVLDGDEVASVACAP